VLVTKRRELIRTAALVAALAVLAGSAAACGGGSDRGAAADSARVSAEEGRSFVISRMQGLAQFGERMAPWYKTLDEALPNVTYVSEDGARSTVSDLAVVGTITAVEKGRGFTVAGEDAPSGTPADFDAKGARWWSLHMTVNVERTIGSSKSPKEVRVYLVSPGPDEFAVMAAGLRSFGRVVLFLREYGPHIQYDTSMYSIVDDGAFFTTVAEDGTLGLPFMDPARMPAALGKLSDLELKGSAPRVIPLLGRSGAAYRAA
jgi:hypothetical protein